jgi:anaerobic selenocysteine-containing dehydrogenase
VAGGTPGSGRRTGPDERSGWRHVVGACPLDCPDGCSWVVTVDGEHPVSLRGNPRHPFTAGALCPKVNPWLEFAASPRRLRRPLRRVGPKGEGRFEPVSWDEALGWWAERTGEVIDRWGGEAIWPFVGTGNVGWVQGASGPAGGRLFNRLGASSHVVTICSISGHVGLAHSLGTAAGMDPEEVVDAGVVVIWGSNTVVANPHWWPFVERARSRGAEVVVVDPVRTATAARADRHLAPLPGTDGALALGLARAVVDAGGADAAFLAERTDGWPEFRRLLEGWPPARAAAVTGVPASEIVALARVIVAAPPLAVKLGQGMQRHRHGGQAARTISCLPAVTGAYGRLGGGLVYSTSPAYGLNRWAVARPDLRPGPVRSLAMTNLAQNLLELDDPPVRLLVVQGANPVVSNPDQRRVRAALAQPELTTVAIELFHTDTTAYADLVLPSTMEHEQVELCESFAHLYLNWNEPAVPPPDGCLPHTEIYRRLAERLGLTEPELHASDVELAAAALDTPALREAGITVERLRRDGFARLPGSSPYRPFAERFPTATGRFQFGSAAAERQGHQRLAAYAPPAESGAVPAGAYALVAAAGRWHVNSTFAGEVRHRRRSGPVEVVVCAADAARDGLCDGQEVTVANDRGSFDAVLRIGPAARPGVAVTTKGRWGDGADTVNATVAELDSDMGRGAVYHDNVVRIAAAGS